MNHSRSIETEVVHAGEEEPIQGGVHPPIFRSSIYVVDEPKSYHDVKYIRSNNTPDQVRLCKKLAILEKGESAVVTASGMAAISQTLMTFLQSGSHILAQKCVYGATYSLLTKDFPLFNIQADFVDGNAPETWEAKLRPETKIFYVESLANPLIEVSDLKAVVAFAKKHGLISIIDSTFITPINFNPLTIGIDLVIHSCSKYLGGHYDIVAGCVVGKADLIQQITERLTHMGGCLDPHVCYLLSRGIATLALRVRQQNQSTLQLAKFFSNHPQVERVIYAGLENHPQHHHAKELFKGYGGVLSFELKSNLQETKQFLHNLSIPLIAPSLGGIKTLITRPAITSHSEMTASERAAIGITDKLLRLSVGIEAVEDLIQDFEQALDKLSE